MQSELREAKTSGARRFDLDWLRDAESILITAGASAPEHLVQGLIKRIQENFGGEVETRTLVEEEMFFELPKSARSLSVIA